MQIPKEHIEYLWNKYLHNEATQAELDELFSYVQEAAENAPEWDFMREGIANERAGQPGFIDMDDSQKMLLVQNVLAGRRLSDPADLGHLPVDTNGNPVVHRAHFLKTTWFRYAAILLLIAGTATYLYTSSFRRNPVVTKMQEVPHSRDMPPGGNRAVLTLADGSTILLDKAANGALTSQGNTRILKTGNGYIKYAAGLPEGEILYNTINTPNGGQYQVSLPDGSIVWLNAASSVRFPTIFVKERKVVVTGEAYFEIAPDKTSPFIVVANGVNIQVLGTSFNVNAYENEHAVKTTLVQGSVKVISGSNLSSPIGKSQIPSNILLRAGEQADLVDGHLILHKKVNIENVVAWKNGFFNFTNADLPTVVRQLERWYDIKARFKGEVPVFNFQGSLERGLNLSDVLDALNEAGVQFRMEDRTLVIGN